MINKEERHLIFVSTTMINILLIIVSSMDALLNFGGGDGLGWVITLWIASVLYFIILIFDIGTEKYDYFDVKLRFIIICYFLTTTLSSIIITLAYIFISDDWRVLNYLCVYPLSVAPSVIVTLLNYYSSGQTFVSPYETSLEVYRHK